MKLNKNFLIHNTDGDAILVPTGKAEFSGIVRGNKSFGAVLELLNRAESGISEEEIVASMKARFDAPAGAVERDVNAALTELRKIGAIDD